jgi:glucose-1-phosphate adenylyltransferase
MILEKIFFPLMGKSRIFAYNFKTAPLPGQKEHEEPGYWRDVGNLESFWSAHMDLLGEKPRLDLNNDDWPIMAGRYNGPPAGCWVGRWKILF